MPSLMTVLKPGSSYLSVYVPTPSPGNWYDPVSLVTAVSGCRSLGLVRRDRYARQNRAAGVGDPAVDLGGVLSLNTGDAADQQEHGQQYESLDLHSTTSS